MTRTKSSEVEKVEVKINVGCAVLLLIFLAALVFFPPLAALMAIVAVVVFMLKLLGYR